MTTKLKQEWLDWLKLGYRILKEQRKVFTPEQIDWVEKQGDDIWLRFYKLHTRYRNNLNTKRLHAYIVKWHAQSLKVL